MAAEEFSLLDEKTMFDAVEIQGIQVNWEIMQLSEEIFFNSSTVLMRIIEVGMICCNFCITKVVSEVD